MSERPRRRGYRTGAMSRQLADALEKEKARISRLKDPQEQARAVSDLVAALDVQLEDFVAIRQDAVVAMRADGMTYQSIADAAGLSLPRVQQLASQAGVAGRRKKPGS